MVGKKFCVVAYDIADSKRRIKLVKLIERYGRRMNLSVFECMFTEAQLYRVKCKIGEILNPYEDSVIIYPLCLECFGKAIYYPEVSRKSEIIDLY